MDKNIKLPELIWKNKYDKSGNINRTPRPIETFNKQINKDNVLFHGDNLKVLYYLLDNGYKDKIDLIYIDPPYATQRVFKNKKGEICYDDRFDVNEYLSLVYERISIMKELLSEKGCIYVHCDWRVNQYLRCILDEIFGHNKHINEIIWNYNSGGASSKQFAKKHDTIFLYKKGEEYIFNPIKEKSYNRGLKPYRFKGVEEYKDEVGWYTLVNMRDVWKIDMVGRTSRERIDYPTQKPEALLERIIKASSNEGSLIADFFCGSGTTAAVAHKLNRKFITSDISDLAIKTTKERLGKIGADFDSIE